jgi:putative membrane protein
MSRSFHVVIGVPVLLASSRALAEAAGTAQRTAAWTWPPYIVVPLFATALVYAAGIFRMRRRGGKLRAMPILCFWAGWTSLLIALDSPMHEISEQLFWVHMTQHEILMLVAVPLLVFSQPAAPFLFALPESWRVPVASIGKTRIVNRAWLFISAPLVAWMLHATALWVWHAPRLFSATLENDSVHAAQHISFLATAVLFWSALVHKHASRPGYGGAILYVFTTAIHTSVLGALLTFAPGVWYQPYTRTAPLWGMSALQDQQLGGLIMWVPAGMLLTVVALVLLAKWMSHSQQRWEYTRAAGMVRASQALAAHEGAGE